MDDEITGETAALPLFLQVATMDERCAIDAGQRITVRADGTFTAESFDLRKLPDVFIKKTRP